jgi:hypothetical protein
MDVSTAYLNGVLDKEIYISPPEGIPIEDGFCWKLKKSIYGLKQAGCIWNHMLLYHFDQVFMILANLLSEKAEKFSFDLWCILNWSVFLAVTRD